MNNIWIANGKTWYSKELVDKVIDLCKKQIYKPKNNDYERLNTVSLAVQVLELLDVESED